MRVRFQRYLAVLIFSLLICMSLPLAAEHLITSALAVAQQNGGSSDTSKDNQSKGPAKGASDKASGEQDDKLVAQGKSRFQAYKCYDCHGKNGEGTDDAPDLTHSKLTAEQVSKFLQKPSADAENKGMPDIPLDSPDHKPLVAYVMSLRAK